MKNRPGYLFLLTIILFASACNKDEGLGGRSTIEGQVFKIIHSDDNFVLKSDTVPAAESDIYLVFGDDTFYGDDTKTGHNGFYRFRYLNSGTYTLYAYNKYPSGEKEAVSTTVRVNRNSTAHVEPIYIHDGKAFGTSIIKGSVEALYYKKEVLVDRGPGHGIRMYVQRAGEETFFDDVRVGENGVFAFQKITPGEYEIYTYTEDIETEALSVVKQKITVTETGQILTLPATFTVVSHV